MVDENVERAWEVYTNPKYIVKWNHASHDWVCPKATNNLKVGGKFSWRMESKDGEEGFDFSGTYTKVIPHERIEYTMDGKDKRKVSVVFEDVFESTDVIVTFDPEKENSIEMQKGGWQAILNNFKLCAEKR